MKCTSCGNEVKWVDDYDEFCTSCCVKYKEIDLIASGYEWTCPKCKELKTEIEFMTQVSCLKCRLTFSVDQYPRH